jgi:hypothetical protein
MKIIAFLLPAIFLVACATNRLRTGYDPIDTPYVWDRDMEFRSISWENPTGEKGKGGMAASGLGVGKKGAACVWIKPGETHPLCNIEGPGVIRHIWMTIAQRKPEFYRSCVIRGWWDGQQHPSIECPLGDFMGFAMGMQKRFQTAVHTCSTNGGMSIWLPMPFTKQARLEFVNDTNETVQLYYQINYTLEDVPDDAGRLHTLFRRENPTTKGVDFEILPKRTGRGRYLGAVLCIRALEQVGAKAKTGSGEGEVKMYIDGDTDFPTYCGTGGEDYPCLAWGHDSHANFMYGGSINGALTFYRWHLPDPVVWREDMRITMMQLGWEPEYGFADRSDDVSSATFWYEPIPSQPLSQMPDRAARTANLIMQRANTP